MLGVKIPPEDRVVPGLGLGLRRGRVFMSFMGDRLNLGCDRLG